MIFYPHKFSLRKTAFVLFLFAGILLSGKQAFCENAQDELVSRNASLNLAMEDVSQILIPREVYVGDTAELRFSFNAPVDLFAGVPAEKINDGELLLNTESSSFRMQNYDVKQVSLRLIGRTYTLSLVFVPWVTGTIKFPAFDLNALIHSETKVSLPAELADKPFVIELQPVEVLSLVKKYNALTLRSPLPPSLLPGTNYIVWSLIILVILLIFAVIFVLAKFPMISEKFYSLSDSLALVKNARQAKHKIRALLKKKCSDAEFAQQWQAITRKYLSARFSTPFNSIATNSIAKRIMNVTGNFMSGEQEDSVISLTSLFTRTDYIRFARNSIDSRLLPSEEHEAAFYPGEKEVIAKLTIDAISNLEANPKGEFSL
ncbi:MAG: hypothetical protein K6E22_11540 [Treponema sp.]|nr:hypothetical protein [Treponema sp.]